MRRERARIWAGLALGACLCVIQFLGWGHGLEIAAEDAFYEIRGERQAEPEVLLVTLDQTYVDELGPPPLESSRLAAVIENIRAGAPTAISVEWTPGFINDVSALVEACDDNAELSFFGSSERPDHLPEGCLWRRTQSLHARGHLRDLPADDGLVGALGGLDQGDSVRINYLGGDGLPRLSAAHVMSDDAMREVFEGRVVLVAQAVPGLAQFVQTPLGPMLQAAARGEAINTARQGAQHRSPGWAPYVLIIFAVIGGLVLVRKSYAVPAIAGATVAWFAVEAALFAAGVSLGSVLAVVGLWATFFVLQGIQVFEDQVREEVRDRLSGAIRTADKRRAYAGGDERGFWESTLSRTLNLLPVEQASIAELPVGSWWIEFRAFHAMDESDIVERRRDVRRSPYKRGLETKLISVTTDYLDDDELESVLVPLFADDQLRGFWFLHTSDADSFVQQHRELIGRIAAQVAHEVYWNQLEGEAPGLLSRQLDASDEVMESALAAMERLELDRRTLEDVAENARVGLMMTNLFGEITFENSTMANLLTGPENQPFQYDSLASLIALLKDEEVSTSTERLHQVLLRGEPLEFRARLDTVPRRLAQFRVTLARRPGDNEDRVSGMIVTAVDITRAVEADRQKLGLVRKIHTQASDLMSVVGGYTEVLSMSSGLGEAEKELVRGLESSLADLDGLFEDFAGVLNPPNQEVIESLPIAMQHVVREALRSTEDAVELPPIELEMPDELLTASGHAESLQRAIKLVLVDSLEYAARADKIRIQVDERGGDISVSLDVPNLGLPNSLLQRLIDETPGEVSREDNRLIISKSYVEASGGRFEALSSVDGGTQFVISLPKHGSDID